MKYSNPIKVVYIEGCVNNAESLLQEKILQIGLIEEDLCEIKGQGSIILDFGKEVSGGVRILTFCVNDDKTVRLRFGESVGETCADLKNEKAAWGEWGGWGTTNDHSLRDFNVQLQNYSDMTFGQTGFRFLRIDTLSNNSVFKLKAVVAAINTDIREEIGRFECDDVLVNEIWNTAAYTLRLCIQNGFLWDGIKRDRLVWIGDLYPEMRAAYCLFGDIPEVLNSLDFAMQQSPLPLYINAMPTYSLWWIICLYEAYKVSGDKDLYIKYISYVKGIVEEVIAAAIAEDGTVSYSFNFLDWPSTYLEGETDSDKKNQERLAGVAFLTKIALCKAKEFFSEFGEDCAFCETLIARINQKKYDIHIYKQIAALGVWTGMLDENIKKTLLSGHAKGLSTFYSYFILTAISQFDKSEEALEVMKQYYGGMLSVGATTFWEDFNLDWLAGSGRIDEMPREGLKDIHGHFGDYCYKSFRHSLCHGWSAGVIPYLVETVAGIKVERMGGSQISIKPKLSGLKYIKVNYPTKYGIMVIEHTLQDNGEIKTDISAPKEIEIIR